MFNHNEICLINLLPSSIIATYFKTGVPYTATMFLIGATMGYFSLNSSHDNAIVESIRIWLYVHSCVARCSLAFCHNGK